MGHREWKLPVKRAFVGTDAVLAGTVFAIVLGYKTGPANVI